MWIRTRNLTFYYDACKIFLPQYYLLLERIFIYSGHNNPKYLGSTGFLPALQSYICQWNNTCYNQSNPTDEFSQQSSFVDFSNLNEYLSVILNDRESSVYLNEIFSQLNSLKNQTNIWNGKSMYIFV
jgi:hypothetical protein